MNADAERVCIMTGRGGQGTKLAAHLVALAGAMDGWSPLHYCIYDGLIRGGNIACTVAIGKEDPAVAIRSRFDVLLALHRSWFERFYPKVAAGGDVFYDPTFVTGDLLTRDDVQHRPIGFGQVARDAGDPRAANMVSAGLLGSHWSVPGLASLEAAVREVTPPHRAERVAANLEALRAGWALARGE